METSLPNEPARDPESPDALSSPEASSPDQPGQPEILVPLDGSDLGEAVLPHAATLALLTSSKLGLVRVVEPRKVLIAGFGAGAPPPDLEDELLDIEVAQARDYLAAVAGRLRGEGVEVGTNVLEGDPADSIVWYASHNSEVKLIAMASHGRSGLGRLMLGSVAEKVLHLAPAPLLLFVRPRIVPPGAEVRPALTYHTIVVPLDGSLFAEQSLVHARVLAVATGATLLLVAAVPHIDDLDLPVYTANPSLRIAAWQAESEGMYSYLDHTARELKVESPQLEIRTQVGHGSPAEVILNASEHAHADLVVMTTHGRSGLQRLWLGSVAMKVVQGATIPVLLVRAVEEAGQAGTATASHTDQPKIGTPG